MKEKFALIIICLVVTFILSCGCTSQETSIPTTTTMITTQPTTTSTTLTPTTIANDFPTTDPIRGCENDADCNLEKPEMGCCDETCYDTTDRICCGGSIQVSYYYTINGRFQYICCNGVLYEQSYSCCNGFAYLIGKGACCNGTVYDPSRQFCCAGKIFEGTGFSCCNGKIVTGLDRCCGDFICPENLQCCATKAGPKCFDPAHYSCM